MGVWVKQATAPAAVTKWSQVSPESLKAVLGLPQDSCLDGSPSASSIKFHTSPQLSERAFLYCTLAMPLSTEESSAGSGLHAVSSHNPMGLVALLGSVQKSLALCHSLHQHPRLSQS